MSGINARHPLLFGTAKSPSSFANVPKRVRKRSRETAVELDEEHTSSKASSSLPDSGDITMALPYLAVLLAPKRGPNGPRRKSRDHCTDLSSARKAIDTPKQRPAD